MKYIMVRLDNWCRTLVQEGCQNTLYSIEQAFCITRLDRFEDLTQSVLNFFKEHWKLHVLENNNIFINGK